MKHRTILLAALALFAPSTADAFCGFYVSGADTKLFNNATQVVLMREGTRTVLSMQNNYQGPPADFAMVVPVPVVLQKENVKTLERSIFDRVDQLTAPRLVEYWEQDPCPKPVTRNEVLRSRGAGAGAPMPSMAPKAADASTTVRIEAQFTVGEYEIVVLSASDSAGLDAWLRQNNYKIPQGAEPYLRPYVQQGFKFFVAKVDVSKVRFQATPQGPNQAMLSPLRFHYDSDQFYLPIRLGLVNSGGTQDLIVNVLAQGQRYEVSNYENVAVPTNLDVAENAKAQFPSFYAALFDRTLERHPKAVVTEYSWVSQSCDPCPVPPLSQQDIMILGGDVLPSMQPSNDPLGGGGPRWVGGGAGFVVTRLHARYQKDALGDDLFFRAAPPIVGGREFNQNGGKLEEGARPSGMNNFQARYAIRHPWTGPITCAHPQRHVWGPPPGQGWRFSPPLPAAKIAFAPRGAVQINAFIKGALPPENVLGTPESTPVLSIPQLPPPDAPDAAAPPDTSDASSPLTPPDAGSSIPTVAPPRAGGCAGCAQATTADQGAAAGILAALAIAFPVLRRVKRRR